MVRLAASSACVLGSVLLALAASAAPPLPSPPALRPLSAEYDPIAEQAAFALGEHDVDTSRPSVRLEAFSIPDHAAFPPQAGLALPALLLSAGFDPQHDGTTIRLSLNAAAFASSAGPFDFDIGPQAGIVSGPAGREADASLMARFGQNLKAPRADEASWYLFARAGKRRVTLAPGAGEAVGLSDLRMERVNRADAQAGFALDLGSADLSLAYTQRERQSLEPWQNERKEGFALLSLNLRN